MSKKKTVNDKLSESLEVEYEVEIESEDKPLVRKVDNLPVTKEKLNKDLEKDYCSVRKNMKNLIDIGEEAIDGILNVASESDSPRAYEVASQMIKTVADMNKDLLDMHQKMKTINKEEVTINHNTNNSIYVGSTSDLQDLINQSRSAKKALEVYDEVIEEDDVS